MASLTDHQVVERFLKPAMARAEQVRADLPPTPGQPGPAPARPAAGKPRRESTGPDFEPGTPGHRKQIEWAFQSVMGMSPEKARKLYDTQLADWEANWKHKEL